jgi:glycosyltransferase involved in cell wall biosynthesis
MKIVINGKFLGHRPTAVHTVAREIILAMDQLLAASTAPAEVIVAIPRGTVVEDLPLSRISLREIGKGNGLWWEQVELPRALDGAVVLSLCNLGPALPRRAVTMIHDLQVYTAPGSSSRAFQLRYKTLFHFIGRRHAKILTVSQFSRDEIVTHKVAAADRIEVVYNGVDHISRAAPDVSVIENNGIVPGRYVLALANAKPHKNIPLLFEAMKDPRLAGVQLVLFGASTSEQFQAQGHTPPPSTIFVGRVEEAQVRALMEHALCVAMPSTTEGFGLPPFEAMHLGTPAIVSSTGALMEIAGDAALLADPSDAAAWADNIAALAGSISMRDDVGARGRDRMASFTWKSAARQTLDACRAAFSMA